ncbi:lipolytic enzyme, GDSL family [Legionella wadsworthii]|uniref:Lipolytic enzyme, GDSL family n=1 Tax=Legionella wadsworthii TaxID=28088 RepID=A0A378LQB5_9GAMM|nr:SGNH/GDSL hydrolase family protein [Legionella wadsworthii]STY28964.1 lipolytic enzyme, GDSL family [Legionella wadsworthii]
MTDAKIQSRKINPTSEEPKEITHFVIFGDSLSDGKNMGEKFRFLGGWINKLWDKALGLDKSPKERFTNGYTWADVLRANLITKFINDSKIKKDSEHRFAKDNLDNADIGDDILSHAGQRNYTGPEVGAEITRVRRKKREETIEIDHVFGEFPSPNPSNIALARQTKTSTKPIHTKKQAVHANPSRESYDDISDQAIMDPRYREYVEDYYSLDNGRTGQFNGHNFFSNYSQGGATSYDYSGKTTFLSLLHPFTAIKLFFTRLIVSHLSKQVDQFLSDVEKQEDYKDRSKTLITIFSGANDLITANSEPTEAAAKKAVESNIANIEKLMKQGYTNIVLCNLPDLSLTPRFQNKSETERKEAQRISKYYNDLLESRYTELTARLHEKGQACSIDLFKIDTVFSKIYEDIDKKGEQSEYSIYFDKDKLRQPYIQSKDYKLNPNGTSPGAKHMFWDDVHPTATMHALLMSEFYKSKEALGKYKLAAPKEQSAKELCERFRKKYHEKLENDWFGFLPSHKEIQIPYHQSEKALMIILRHALDKKDKKADMLREAMSDLGWWVNGEPNMRIPALADAMWYVDSVKARKLEEQLDPHLAQSKRMQSQLHSPKLMMTALSTGTPSKKAVPSELALPPEVERKLAIMQSSPIKQVEAPLWQPKTGLKETSKDTLSVSCSI